MNVGLRFIGLGDENSPASHHAIAIALGSDTHDLLKIVLEDIAAQLVEINAQGLEYKGERIKVEVFLAADWKFLRMCGCDSWHTSSLPILFFAFAFSFWSLIRDRSWNRCRQFDLLLPVVRRKKGYAQGQRRTAEAAGDVRQGQ